MCELCTRLGKDAPLQRRVFDRDLNLLFAWGVSGGLKQARFTPHDYRIPARWFRVNPMLNANHKREVAGHVIQSFLYCQAWITLRLGQLFGEVFGTKLWSDGERPDQDLTSV